MLKRVRTALFFLFVALLFACSFDGTGTPLGSATYGAPTRWLVNKEFSGRVFDFSSCAEIDQENETILFYPSRCIPVSDAKITLYIGDSLPTGEGNSEDFKYTTKSDKNGQFKFESHTTIRLIDLHDNTYHAGLLEISAEGYDHFKEVVSWYPSGDNILGMHRDYTLRDFGLGRIKKPLFVEVTIVQ